jgi:hypothetical protein
VKSGNEVDLEGPIGSKSALRLLIVRREQKEKTVPAERSALSFAKPSVSQQK